MEERDTRRTEINSKVQLRNYFTQHSLNFLYCLKQYDSIVCIIKSFNMNISNNRYSYKLLFNCFRHEFLPNRPSDNRENNDLEKTSSYFETTDEMST
jgi:hypothetical protein